MRQVKISRKKWLRGPGQVENPGPLPSVLPNFLWDIKRKAGCCLGHVCKQISRKTELQLNGKGEPREVFDKKSVLTDVESYWTGTITRNNGLADSAMHINDASYHEKERERLLIKLFKKHNIKLTFVD